MKTVCLALCFFSCLLPAAISDGHLACPVGRACPVSTPPISNLGTGACDNTLRASIRADTESVLTGYLSNDNEYFSRVGQRYLGQTAQFPATSCAEIITTAPSSMSGYYWVGGRRVYCVFDLSAPGDAAWERVQYFDLSNPSVKYCPDSNWRLVEPAELRGRYCVKRTTGEGCSGFVFSPATVPFTRVYGRVIGVQIGEANSIKAGVAIGDNYLDGLSLTTQNGDVRQHIWSFLAYSNESESGCPCSTGTANPETPDFVGDDYFCESGTASSDFESTTAFPDDPLWDGNQCGGLEGPCCVNMIEGARSPPWFYKAFDSPVPSGSNLELRICTSAEGDIGVQLIELYVQ